MAAVPSTLKTINSFIKLGKEYDKRDPTVAYFCRMYAVQRGIKLDSKSPDCKKFLFGLMDQLEQTKKVLADRGDEAVTNDIVAQAHVENMTVGLFTWADSEDRKGVFNKNIIKAFYSASLLYEVLSQFGELNDECKVQQKYAKWKATYLHKCMQTGETPIPGPEGSGFEDDLGGLSSEGGSHSGMPTPSVAGYPPDTTPYPPQPYPSQPYPPGQQYPPGPSQPSQPFSYSQPPPPQDKPTPKPRQPASTQPEASYTDTSNSYGDTSNIDFTQASKFCKFAMSALQYEDVDTAVDNLTKALDLLKSGIR